MTSAGVPVSIPQEAYRVDIMPEQVQQAYLLWATDPKHSCAAVARETGRDDRTIRAWRDHYRWQDRLADVRGDVQEPAQRYLRLRMAEAIDTAVDTLTDLMASTDDRVRLGAVRTLIQVVNPDKGVMIDLSQQDHRSITLNGLDLNSTSDLAKALQQGISGSLDHHAASTAKRKR